MGCVARFTTVFRVTWFSGFPLFFFFFSFLFLWEKNVDLSLDLDIGLLSYRFSWFCSSFEVTLALGEN